VIGAVLAVATAYAKDGTAIAAAGFFQVSFDRTLVSFIGLVSQGEGFLRGLSSHIKVSFEYDICNICKWVSFHVNGSLFTWKVSFEYDICSVCKWVCFHFIGSLSTLMGLFSLYWVSFQM